MKVDHLVALSDRQLALITSAARPLSPEKRAILLERIAGVLSLCGRGRGFGDADVDRALRQSLTGMLQSSG